MNPKQLVVMAGVVCMLLFGGCRSTGTVPASRGARTAADIRRAELMRELERKWENPDAHYELGQLYHAAGDWSKAQWHYNIAMGFDPSRRDVQAAIVKLQFDRGDRSKGEWAAETYITQAAFSAEQLLALGVAFENHRLDDYALKCYHKALESAANSPAVNRRLGYYYLERDNKDLAKEYFIRSFQLDPGQPDVAAELGRLGVAVRVPQSGGSPQDTSR